ncbi:MAG: DUF192 domain-containing protein [Verrucomicrobiota bacterium]|nr:DUF192 domain-containing protein [Verrucomicrobiota bacterium]
MQTSTLLPASFHLISRFKFCKKLVLNLLLLSLCVWISGCSEHKEIAQPKLPTKKIQIASKVLDTEIARTTEQKNTGLMGRKSLGENEGMLFINHSPQTASFWMKNTLIPLSIAYIDEDGVIQEIYHLEPLRLDTVQSRQSNIKYALEVNKGWFEKNGISIKQKISVKDGDLSQLEKE